MLQRDGHRYFSERTVWSDLHGRETQEFLTGIQEEILRQQLWDIEQAPLELRLKYRHALLELLGRRLPPYVQSPNIILQSSIIGAKNPLANRRDGEVRHLLAAP